MCEFKGEKTLKKFHKTFANTNNLGAYANRFVGKANPFESNWLYGTYSWYEATREE